VQVMVVSNTACGNGNNSTQQGGGMIRHSGIQGHFLPSTAASVCAFLIDKITLKAVNKEKKAVSKMFQLRNINPQSYSSLANLIRSQLKDDITGEGFDVGYLNGSNCISIQTKDVVEVWNNVKKGFNVVLWCDGLKTRAGSKRQPSNDDDSSSHSAKKDTQEQVQKVVDILKKQNGDKYTGI